MSSPGKEGPITKSEFNGDMEKNCTGGDLLDTGTKVFLIYTTYDTRMKGK